MDDSSVRVTVACSSKTSADQAFDELRSQLDCGAGSSPSISLLFMTCHYRDDAQMLARRCCEWLGSDQLLGCTAEAIVSGSQELEDQSGLVLWCAWLPKARISTMHLQLIHTQDGGSIVGWAEGLPQQWPADSAMLMLGEPFSFPADYLAERLATDQPGKPLIGGMASGASAAGQNRLILGNQVHSTGAVTALVTGDFCIRTVVSQGCRPIGQSFVVTRAERNVIHELGGISAFERLRQTFESLPNREKEIVQHGGLHIGRALSEYHDQRQQGDFLVRSVVQVDHEAGTIAVGDFIRVGQTVQFHVRDNTTADDDLKQLLAQDKEHATGEVRGGLLFTCNGRGRRMFDQPNHDAGMIQATYGNVPLAGFFAQGELGPVAGRSFLHGFTASLALFQETRPSIRSSESDV